MTRQFVNYLGKQVAIPKLGKKEKQSVTEDVHEDVLLGSGEVPNLSNTSMTIEVPPEPVAPPPVVQTNTGVAESVLESLVAMLNQILQELAAIHQKLDTKKTTTEEVSVAPPKERTVMLIRDENDKVIGGKIVDVVKEV
jgi:hypothetical protein